MVGRKRQESDTAMFLPRPILLLALLQPLATVAAAPVQPLEDIERAVAEHVAAGRGQGDDVEYSIGRLDPRLRLPLCARPLTARHTHQARASGPMSIEVRCEGDKPWALYVPVTVARYAEVVVASRALARGAPIAAADLSLERRRIDARHADYLVDPALAAGQLASRPIGHGQVLTRSLLERPRLVRRGDHVVLRSGARGIQVQVKGEALEDGALGERISVLNLRSERVIEGTVEATGSVVVGRGAML